MIFPTRPRRNSGEGTIGYLMRLGETHGIPDLAEVLIQVRVPWFELAQGKLIDVVAKATAVESAALAFDTGTVAAHGVVLRGEHLRRRQWSVHASRRACPECLAADRASGNGGCLPRQWHRAWWDVQPATVCPIHGVRLLCSCPICGSELNFKSTALGKCPNGHPIDVASSDKANNFAGDAYIAGRLGAAPRMLNHVLDEGRLGEAIEALELVGSVALTISRHRSSAKHERHQVLDAGYSVFSGWPTAFDQLLDDLQASSKTGVGNWGAAATYGPLHIGLQELRSGNVLVAMKERLRRHAAKNGISISKPVFGVVVPPTEIYSARQAAKRLGMGFERARQELRLRGQLPVRTRRGTPIRVSSAVVEEIAARRQAEIGVLKLAGHLAIGRSQTRRLVASGMLGEDPSVFRVTDIEKFLQKLSRGAPTKFDRTGVASLPDSCRTARCAIETAIVAILDGRLPVVGIEPDQGLSGIFVRVATLRSIGKASRNVMTYDDAAKALSIKWESLRDFTSFGGDVPKRDALAAGYTVFADGVAGFSGFLDSLVAAADIEQGKWGPRVAYGRVYEWLSHDTRDAIYDPIRELVREHAIDNIPMGPDDLVFGKPVGARRVYTLWHLSKAINTGPASARRILRALGHLTPADEPKENWQIIFKAPVVELVKSTIEDWMNFNEARSYLGLPRAPMHNLFDAGLTKPFLHVSTGVAEHMFRKRDLDVFVAKLIGSAPVCKNQSDNLCNIVVAGKRSQTSTVDVVSALMEGRIKSRGCLGSETGLMRILVDLEEVNVIRDAGVAAPTGLSIDDCRKRLGITWPVVSSLIRRDYMRVTPTLWAKYRKRNMIDEGSFQEFLATYISATEVAASRKTHVRILVPELRRINIEPAIEKNDVGQYFYRRSDIASLSV